MTEQDLTDAILRQAIELQRLSAGDETRAEAILRELEGELRALLASGNLSASSKREVEALIREAEKAIAGKYINIAGVVDVEAIVEHVADQTVRFMDETFPTAISSPPLTTLRSLAQDILIDGSPASAWWARQSADTAFRFAGTVRRGVINGATNEQIVREVVGKGGLTEVSRRNARTLVHSSIMTAANRARLETFRRNAKSAAGVKWLATLDSHTCLTCATLDGAQWDFDGKPINGTKKAFAMPPAHWSCFPADTLVSPVGGITGASKRWFDGEMVVVKTAAGREFTCTPNHPILTDRGWLAAGLLNVGGNVVCDGRGEWERLTDWDGENVPARIHDVTESFFSSVAVEAVPVPVSTEDFHGDGGGSDVAIVWSNRLLCEALNTPITQPVDETLLVAGSAAGLVNLTTGGHLAQCIEGHLTPLAGCVCSGDLSSPLIAGHTFPFEAFSFGSGSASDAVLTQDSGDHDALQIELLGDSIFRNAGDVGGANGALTNDGFGPDWYAAMLQCTADDVVRDASLAADFSGIKAGDVELDAIVECRRVDFSGHVYNLETSTGLYVAQGVVVHNCRCILTPIPAYSALEELFPGISDKLNAAGARASSSGPLKSGSTFGDFLDRQSPEWVDQWMGKRRADLYRAGKLTLTDLVTKGGREKTLADLKL